MNHLRLAELVHELLTSAACIDLLTDLDAAPNQVVPRGDGTVDVSFEDGSEFVIMFVSMGGRS